MSGSLSLYTLSTELQAIAARLQDDGLDPETIKDTIDSLSQPFEDKAKAVASVAKSFRALALQIKAAEAEMAERRKALERRAERLDEYLLDAMLATGIQKIESPWFAIAVKKNPPKVVLFDELQIPARFWRQPEPPPPVIDKQSIAAELKLGKDVPGAKLESGHRLEVR